MFRDLLMSLGLLHIEISKDGKRIEYVKGSIEDIKELIEKSKSMSSMKNIPGKIYLQIGDECDSEDFNELSEVSWCKDKIYDNDIEFALQNKVYTLEDMLWAFRIGRAKEVIGELNCKTTIEEFEKYLITKKYVSNEKKDNIPADFKEVTGHDSPKEMVAYEKGREDEQQVISEWIEKWDGSTNSVMGALLKKKFDERKDNAGVWVKTRDRWI